MLNINQNFDLKAPVFNFDRDYFNSVEELNAYDTSNVPNHFVTNVAGMLYLFTDGKWLPMIGTTDDDSSVINIGIGNIQITNQNSNPNLWMSTVNGFGATYSSTYLAYSSDDDNKHISLDVNDPYLMIDDSSATTYIYNDNINISGVNDSQKILLNVNDAEAVENDGSSVNVLLTDDDLGYIANINAGGGFRHSDSSGCYSNLSSTGLNITEGTKSTYIYSNTIAINNRNGSVVKIGNFDNEYNLISLGSDYKFKISRPVDDTEGATITGIKSLTAFANPSATKVWATDGSTVDLTTKANASDLATKANASDVLLKKSTDGGYYIEENGNELGWKAFAANIECNASGLYSFAEGYDTQTSGNYSHVEGFGTHAKYCSHAEGAYTNAIGDYSHAEGSYTNASGIFSHALGTYNVVNYNAIHSVGIGNSSIRRNAEYIYAETTSNGAFDTPKIGYKYLIGVGGYDGISTNNDTYKSVQEVIADLTARIEQLETKVRALEAANTPA